jgi:hypothetical protein
LPDASLRFPRKVVRTDEATLLRSQNIRKLAMPKETKKQQQDRLIAEFLRRIREAPPGERVYMSVGDLFEKAEVIHIEERRTKRPMQDRE